MLKQSVLGVTLQQLTPELDGGVVIDKGLEEKNEQATNTISFIEEQMSLIGDSLMNFLVEIDDYKLENRDMMIGSSFVFEKLNALDQEKSEIILANTS